MSNVDVRSYESTEVTSYLLLSSSYYTMLLVTLLLFSLLIQPSVPFWISASSQSYSFAAVSAASSTIYVSGVSTKTCEEDIIAHFKQVGMVRNVSIPINPITTQRHGYALVTYMEPESATRATKLLHRSKLGKKQVQVRMDDIEKEQERGRSRLKLAAVRSEQQRHAKQDKAYYTGRSVMLTRGMVEYPFPTGLYLTQLLQLFHSSRLPVRHQVLFDILIGSKIRLDSRHAKGITETVAMVYGLKKAIQLIKQDVNMRDVISSSTSKLVKRLREVKDLDALLHDNVRVFAVADGVAPYTASAFNLLLPDNKWMYYTIDPILSFTQDLWLDEELKKRVQLIKQRTNEFKVPKKNNIEQLSVVIACHSHAPLQEFWDRIEAPKIAIVMPCCNEEW